MNLTKLGGAETGWLPQGGSGIYGEEELDKSSTEMKPYCVGLDSCSGYGQASSAWLTQLLVLSVPCDANLWLVALKLGFAVLHCDFH